MDWSWLKNTDVERLPNLCTAISLHGSSWCPLTLYMAMYSARLYTVDMPVAFYADFLNRTDESHREQGTLDVTPELLEHLAADEQKTDEERTREFEAFMRQLGPDTSSKA